jgi:Na+-translocating ferredoxin:NAD+ oxidoreductase RnfA subunit
MMGLFFYYAFFSSVVFVYGIGLDRASLLSKKRRNLGLKIAKMILCVSSTSALSYLFVNGLLVPADLGELFPFAAVLIFAVISVFVEAIIRITTKISGAEFGASILFILLSLAESSSLAECVLISCFCTVSFFACIPVLFSISHRIELNENLKEHKKTGFILVSVAIISLITLCWNVSWLNKGVFSW